MLWRRTRLLPWVCPIRSWYISRSRSDSLWGWAVHARATRASKGKTLNVVAEKRKAGYVKVAVGRRLAFDGRSKRGRTAFRAHVLKSASSSASLAVLAAVSRSIPPAPMPSRCDRVLTSLGLNFSGSSHREAMSPVDDHHLPVLCTCPWFERKRNNAAA